jgi:hypothetical protein
VGTQTMEHGRHRLARLQKKLERVPNPAGTGYVWEGN